MAVFWVLSPHPKRQFYGRNASLRAEVRTEQSRVLIDGEVDSEGRRQSVGESASSAARSSGTSRLRGWGTRGAGAREAVYSSSLFGISPYSLLSLLL